MPPPGEPNGHVIVCGLHADGFRVVEHLRAAGVEVVMVDDPPDTRNGPHEQLLRLLQADVLGNQAPD